VLIIVEGECFKILNFCKREFIDFLSILMQLLARFRTSVQFSDLDCLLDFLLNSNLKVQSHTEFNLRLEFNKKWP
jgi:hypothetical protein